MNELIEKIKENRVLQIIIALSLFFIFIFIFKSLLFSKKEKIPCYQETIKIWSPFKDEDMISMFKPLEKYCLNFEFVEKSLEDIDKEILLAVVENNAPDIVYLDSDIYNKYSKIFATPTPINVDSLVAYYNIDILNFFQLRKPRTLDELKNFIQEINQKKPKPDFYSIGLGTLNVRNRKEIVLTLMSLNENFKEKEKFIENFTNSLSIYKDFDNPQSEYFSYVDEAGDDLLNFAQEKLAAYIGFYQDKKEIESLNPRLNYEINFLPFETFPPKAKVYSKIYYLAPIKKKNMKAVNDFLNWFSSYQLKKIAEIYVLVPFTRDENLSQDKKVVLETVKNKGETFDFFNKKIIFDNFDEILKNWDNESEKKRIIENIYYSLWEKLLF